MKFALICLAFIGLASAAPTPYGLEETVEEILALIPTEDLIVLYHKYENDPDVVKVVAYLKSNDMAKVMAIINNVPEVKDLVKYIEAQGVPIIETLNKLADRLGLPHWPSSYTITTSAANTRAWRDMLEEAKALIPVQKIAAIVLDKLANDEAVQELYEKVSELDHDKIMNELLSHPEIKDALARLTNLGVDLNKIWDFVKSFFGWDTYALYDSGNLKQDFDDIMALIPVEKFIALFHQFENDEDVKKIVAYLKSGDFKKVVNIVVNVPEVKDIVTYLDVQGIPVIEILNKLADRLGLPHWGSYKVDTSFGTGRNWRDFLEEAKKLVDIDAIKGLVVDKLANSEAVQQLYEKIAAVDAQKLHDAALSHPEIVDLLARVNNLGIDTKEIWETVKDFFGWN